ncbi:MAG: hypothetical protein ACFFD1_07625 [Candidatus Thorarchaeota archaeon]
MSSEDSTKGLSWEAFLAIFFGVIYFPQAFWALQTITEDFDINVIINILGNILSGSFLGEDYLGQTFIVLSFFLLGSVLFIIFGILVIHDRYSKPPHYFYSKNYRKRFKLLVVATIFGIGAGLFWLLLTGDGGPLPYSFMYCIPLGFTIIIRFNPIFSKSAQSFTPQFVNNNPQGFSNNSLNQPNPQVSYQPPVNTENQPSPQMSYQPPVSTVNQPNPQVSYQPPVNTVNQPNPQVSYTPSANTVNLQSQNLQRNNFNLGARAIAIANRASMKALGVTTGKKGESEGSIIKILFYLGVTVICLIIIALLSS